MMPLRDETWWASAFRFAVVGAGIAPAQFWQLTLPELEALADAPAIANAPCRDELEAMMQAFPDGAQGGSNSKKSGAPNAR